MQVTECTSGDKKLVTVRALDKKDLRTVSTLGFSFNWAEAAKGGQVYKLCLAEDNTIIGLVSLIELPGDHRIEIKLLESSRGNIGKGKDYEGIAGNLISFACRKAILNYGDLACVSLLPKTVLKSHYMQKYGMLDGGRHLYLEGIELLVLTKKYPL